MKAILIILLIATKCSAQNICYYTANQSPWVCKGKTSSRLLTIKATCYDRVRLVAWNAPVAGVNIGDTMLMQHDTTTNPYIPYPYTYTYKLSVPAGSCYGLIFYGGNINGNSAYIQASFGDCSPKNCYVEYQ